MRRSEQYGLTWECVDFDRKCSQFRAASTDPARLVRQRREDHARIGFLSEEKEFRLREAILKKCPHQHVFLNEVEIGSITHCAGNEEWYAARFSQLPR